MRILTDRFRYLLRVPAAAQECVQPCPPVFSARALWVLVGLGILWRCVRYFLVFPIWPDEAYVSLNLIDQTCAGLAQPLRFIQVAPYFFLCTELWLYQWLGGSELVLRLVSLIAGVGGLVLFVKLAHDLLDASSARLACGILAVSYFCIQYSAEVKPYSLDLAVAVALLLLGRRWLMEPARWRWPLALAALLPVALGYSYPGVFIAGGIGLTMLIFWLRQPTRRGFLQLALFGGVLVVSFGLFYLLVGRGQFQSAGAEQNPFWGEWFFPWTDPLAWPRWLWDTHAGALMAYPLGQRNGASTLTFFLFLVGVITLAQRRRGLELTMLLAPFLLTIIASALQRYPYGGNARVAQHLAPAIVMLAGLGGVQVMRLLMSRSSFIGGHSPWLVNIVLTVLVLIGAGGMIRDAVFPAKSKDDLIAQQIPEEIQRLAAADAPIVLWGKDHELATGLEWYLTRLPNPRIGRSVAAERPGALGDEVVLLAWGRRAGTALAEFHRVGGKGWRVARELTYRMERRDMPDREMGWHRVYVLRREALASGASPETR